MVTSVIGARCAPVQVHLSWESVSAEACHLSANGADLSSELRGQHLLVEGVAADTTFRLRCIRGAQAVEDTQIATLRPVVADATALSRESAVATQIACAAALGQMQCPAGGSAIAYDDDSAAQLCLCLGYRTHISLSEGDAEPGSATRCFHSPTDNFICGWDAGTLAWIRMDARDANRCIGGVTCVDVVHGCGELPGAPPPAQ